MGALSVAQVKTSPNKKEINYIWKLYHGLMIMYFIDIYFSLGENCVLKSKILKFMGYLKTN